MFRYVPKSWVCFREGYRRTTFFGDLAAGVTVGIIALPLAMAFGIASIPADVASQAPISPPMMGLVTAVVAGFLISALGGSRVQIGGPTGAFIVIVYGIAARHGYDGLVMTTLMAGVIVAIMGLARIGGMIKFIPYPVTTGFTTGIALIIFTSQVKDFLGLQADVVPPDFAAKWILYAERIETIDAATTGVGAASLLIMIVARRFAPRIPGAILAVVGVSFIVWIFGIEVETIGTRFGGIPSGFPAPRWPTIDFTMIRDLIPEATTIAMLAAIESLLSAVVADGMTGGRHKADCELVAQGVANVACGLFGGLPATGAIARTAANIKSGAKTPLAGMVHAITLLGFMLLLAPLASAIPLATLSAVLMMVAWNMSERDHFKSIFKAPRSDVAVLLTTFGLTVFTDLTLAVGVGMILASLLFMKRMADVSNVSAIGLGTSEEGADDLEREGISIIDATAIPPGVEVYEINGPFFFGVADRLKDVLATLERPPAVFILRMRRVSAIDATGLQALREFHQKCRRKDTVLLLSGVHKQPLFAFTKSGLDEVIGIENMYDSFESSLRRAHEIVETPALEPSMS